MPPLVQGWMALEVPAWPGHCWSASQMGWYKTIKLLFHKRDLVDGGWSGVEWIGVDWTGLDGNEQIGSNE